MGGKGQLLAAGSNETAHHLSPLSLAFCFVKPSPEFIPTKFILKLEKIVELESSLPKPISWNQRLCLLINIEMGEFPHYRELFPLAAISHLLLLRPRRKLTPRLQWRALRFVSHLLSFEKTLQGTYSPVSISSYVMKDHVVASRNDKGIESIGSEIKRLSGELEAAKREGKRDAEEIEDLTEDWRRICQENKALTTQVVAQKAKVAALEVERDRDIRRASRIARHDIEQRCREFLGSLKDKWTSKKKGVSAEIQLQEVPANIDFLNELKDGGLTVDAELARLKELEGIVRISLLQPPCRTGRSLSSIFLKSLRIRWIKSGGRNMASRRSNPLDSDRVQTQTCSINAERIRSGDVSEALTEVLREETRLPRASVQEVKDLEGEKSASRVKSSSPTGSEGRDCPLKKAKTNGPDHHLGVLGEAAVAKPFH
ncbi:hypothetical protein F2Q69_00046396 [Brassica cretica]|uniref:Uncharacterized protein n=1 Tax=Brassica cretica TaxID=69181 RepID=A0A8S9PG41_BRACR|nr:hypothetical protein F2Q69_00046396 [Brassica cretica]